MYKLSREEKKADGQYFADLDAVIDDLYKVAASLGLSWHKLAEKAVLSPSTVSKLGDRITKRPQFRTVFHIAQAVGAKITIVHEGDSHA